MVLWASISLHRLLCGVLIILTLILTIECQAITSQLSATWKQILNPILTDTRTEQEQKTVNDENNQKDVYKSEKVLNDLLNTNVDEKSKSIQTTIIDDSIKMNLLSTCQDEQQLNQMDDRTDSIVIGSDSSSVEDVEDEDEEEEAEEEEEEEEEEYSPNDFLNVEDDESLKKFRIELQQHKIESPVKTTVKFSPPPSSNNLIAGRIISFGSGFKIPKRPSQESVPLNMPPEKKSKTNEQSPPTSAPKAKRIKSTKTVESTSSTSTSSHSSVSVGNSSVSLGKTPANVNASNTEANRLKNKKIPSRTSTKPPNTTTTTTTTATTVLATQKPKKPVTNVQKSNKIHSDTKTASSSATSSSSVAAAVSRPVAKPTRHEIQDSDVFMTALNSASELQTQRTVHRQSSNTVPSRPSPTVSTVTRQKTENAITPPQASTTATVTITLTSSVNNNTDSVNSNNNDVKTEDLPTQIRRNDSSSLFKSNLTEPGVKKTVKKKLVWADAHSKPLESVHVFFLEESERAIKKSALLSNTKGCDMTTFEKLNEREMRYSIQNYHDDPNEDTNSQNWPSELMLIDLPDTIVRPEIKSAERDIQAEREKTTLALLVFKHNLPDSASEPDATSFINSSYIESKIIPFEDVNTQAMAINEQQQQHATIEANLNFPLNDMPQSYIEQQQAPMSLSALLPQTIATPDLTVPPPSHDHANIFSFIPTNNLLPSDEAAEQIKNILKNIEIQKTQIEQQHQLPLPQLPQQQQQPLAFASPLNILNGDGTNLEALLANLIPPILTAPQEPPQQQQLTNKNSDEQQHQQTTGRYDNKPYTSRWDNQQQQQQNWSPQNSNRGGYNNNYNKNRYNNNNYNRNNDRAGGGGGGGRQQHYNNDYRRDTDDNTRNTNPNTRRDGSNQGRGHHNQDRQNRNRNGSQQQSQSNSYRWV